MTEVIAAAPRPAWKPSHPGALLREEVVPALHMPVTKVAEALQVSRQTLHAILAERAGVTVPMAVRLGKLCGNGPDFWLRMQQAHDLWEAERELAEVVERIPTLTEA
ncbi:Virulence-associated protein I (plasmid) [Roseomonas mucosa]|uniref:Virulence-associated protein I n=1 Tax=Roseomonas mucosa TaxID=207340 RepID=A0A4Y1MSQ8_9PROT|nr:HigA family addiction module antitoxin [Roseomonas mucosa]AWV20633.1 Virulence-associated protein I [Roseomonas mucosa]MDT8262045.1 HigA family addiction module antitoxin [Roseomonas sp. DSM 102946]MDT8356690.1 HigA family addiction module antitoxin [Roseomonas mucosa]QDJ12317.1 Virulence-associated protein I [Roseomonas mucosa]